ncbi:MAG: acyltransferase family protein [Alphaproteobacteria bacterium]|nr:acyltransferase family protein [Alphaproteobacteria bacterium]
MLKTIQILRAVAIIQVVFLHLSVGFSEFGSIFVPLFTDFGWLGVRLFFVISGFIIAKTIQDQANFKIYILKRYLRVFPLYFIFTFISVYIYSVSETLMFSSPRNDYGAHVDIEQINITYWIGASFLMIPQDIWPIYNVGWSLEHEILFYVIFGISFFIVGMRASLLFMAVLILMSLFLETILMQHIFLSFPYFLMGMLVYYLREKSVYIKPLILFFLISITGAINIYHLYFFKLNKVLFIFLNAIFFATIVEGALRLENKIPNNKLANSFVVLGDMSFSIYLTHYIVVVLLSLILMSVFPSLGVEHIPYALFLMIFVSCILIVLLVSALVYYYIEQPIHNLVRRVFKKK